MEASPTARRLFDWCWLLAWAVASSVWCVTAGLQLGATFDEPGDLARGLEWWRTGSHRELMKVGAMPLPMDLDTLPIYLWERAHEVRLDLNGPDLEAALPWARAGTLVFWLLLLVYGRLIGRAVGGPWAGRLAVALLAVEPCLLAHATLATKDIAISACLMALVYHYQAGREAGWARRVALPGLWFGLALLAKASGLVFGPLCLAVIELERLGRAGALRTAVLGGPRGVRAVAGRLWALLQPLRRDLAWVGALGLAVALVYCGSDWQPERSFVAWAHGLSDGPLARAAVWTAEHLCVFSNAGEGLVRQVMHNIRGHDGVYLLGQADRGALWYYYPLALTMKLSPALLALPLLLAVVRPRALANWACLAAAGLLVYTLNCRVQIGVRLVLPLVALGVAGLAGAVVRAAAEATPGRRRLLAGVAMVGVACTAWAAVVVWPDGLCYTNFLWGGTGRGYLCLSDSNYDWGQGLKELARWKQRHGDHDLDVWYFGTDPAIRDATFRHLPLHTLPVRGPEDVLARVHGHYLAVSTTLLYGGYGPASKNGPVENDHRRAATFLRACRPVDRTPTFLIFDFRGEQPQGARAPSAEVTTVH